MITMSNYEVLQPLYQSSHSIVYCGARKSDGRPVILKMLKNAHPSHDEVARFQREYEMTRDIDEVGVISVLGLERYRNTVVMVMEDFGAQPLSERIQQGRPDLLEVLDLGEKIARVLGRIHARRIMHKDINPANIVWNAESGEIKIIDFGISTQLSHETPAICSPNILEGTLLYMSPEQTGRMNRTLDYRTDIYSLGATLYALLTGKPPFDTRDAMELVHCHIAKTPKPPHEVDAEIPPTVSAIIMKMLAKTAEARYQSAFGVAADLCRCQSNGRVKRWESFAIGQHDFSDQFQIPQKLYGREQEIETLLEAFTRISQGNVEMMLVAGYSGIGKSAVVQEVHKPITEKRGFFISGKCDQYKRNAPYSSLLQAFRELLRQLLTHTDEQVRQWKTRLMDELGSNAQVIIDMIPELGLILGKQPPVAKLASAESENRFNLVFQQFVRAFGARDHPVVMFLDDLQWVDPPSLKLIELIIRDADAQYILIVGAYRDNEVDASHPLIAMLKDMQRAGVMVSTITLQPLDDACVNQLISDTLKCDPAKSQALAQLCFQKTQGNPFFLNQFFRSVYEEGLITFDSTAECWVWDVDRIQQQGMTDNVVELMVVKIQKFSPRVQQVLKLAAAIGNPFDLKTLSIVNQQTPMATAQDLWESLEAGLILPLDNAYKFLQETNENPKICYRFLHDRVQQAAYALIQQTELEPVHLKIGRLLLQNTPSEQLDERLFDIVDQLNQGRNLIQAQAEKNQLVRLNIQAGQKAKMSTAYHTAVRYLSIGLELLPQDAWQAHYDLALELTRGLAEVAYLSGDFEQAEALYPIAVTHANTELDKISVYTVQMTQYQLQGRFMQAIDIQRVGLQLLGLHIPESETALQALLNQGFADVCANLQERPIETLSDAPEMTQPEHLASMQLLLGMWYAAYLSGKITLNALTAVAMTNLSLRHGNSDISAFGYVNYAFLLGFLQHDYQTGYRFGTTGVALSKQRHNIAVRSSCHFLFATFTNHWNRHLRSSDPLFDSAYAWAVESGDFATVGYIIAVRATDRVIQGKNLAEQLCKITEQDFVFLAGSKQIDMIDCTLAGAVQPIRNLMGLTRDVTTFDDAHFSEAEFLNKYQAVPLYPAYLYHAKIRAAFLFNQRDTWLDDADKLALVETYVPGQCKIPEAVFYTALILIGAWEDADATQVREQLWGRLKPLREKLQMWANNCAENYRHKHLLVEAEAARVQERSAQAMDYYQQAIQSARDNDYINTEALGNELYGRFWQQKNQDQIAQMFINEAYYLFAVWGASAKVALMEKMYASMIVQDDAYSAQGGSTVITTEAENNLDLASVMKASQTISEEIVQGELLKKILKIVIENAGAEKGYFVLESEGQLTIEAEGQADREDGALSASVQNALQCRAPLLPRTILQYVARTQETVVLDDAQHTEQFATDPYITKSQPKSILCAPVLRHGALAGILYLENNLTTGAFTPDRLEVLKLLSSQAAISIENASLYANLEEIVAKRTADLKKTLKQVEAVNREVIESIQYAQMIQASLLPNPADVQRFIPDSFFLWLPRDLVGGDIYFAEKTEMGYIVAVIDCTGHGVPGALMTMIASSGIRRIVSEEHCQDPAEILNRLNFIVKTTLQQEKAHAISDDGLDAAVCLVRVREKTLKFAGANLPMICALKSQSYLIKGDRHSIGYRRSDLNYRFTNHQIPFGAGTRVYLFTDGFRDQMGGVKGLPFGARRFQDLVCAVSTVALELQADLLMKAFERYRGDHDRQDDITVVGFEIH